jgi:hypothetical protein
MNQIPVQDPPARAAGTLESAVGNLAGTAKAEIDALASQAAATAGQAYGQVRDAAAAVSETVERQPLIALLGAGLLFGAVGFLLGRR